MIPSSAKQKGRKFQQFIRDLILKYFKELEPDDCRSTSMGAGGEDVLLSPRARKLLPISIECKHRKSFSVYSIYEQAQSNAGKYEPVVFLKGNHKQPLAIVDAEYLIKLMRKVNE
jgi:hypothetical protein